MKILVLGSKGQLGCCLQDQFAYTKYEVIYASRNELDLSKLHDAKKYISKLNPDIIINASAYSDVDNAEKNIKEAYLINHIAVKNIAYICSEKDIWMIHISTDYVFDGTSNRPYKVNDKTSPRSVYGQSKLNGEISIVNSSCKFLIIRTAWLFSEYGKNFVKTMLRLNSTHTEISVVGDQIGSPTYTQDFARAIISTLKYLNEETKSGIYHYSGNPECTWAEFAQHIFNEARQQNKINKLPKIKIIDSSEYPTPVKRPSYSVLDTSLFESSFNYERQNWSDGIKQVINLWDGSNFDSFS
jgi:dTDP-4-dehydrorhamnose reductase